METSQSPPKLKKAVKKVKKKKMPLAATARKYNIPERTLRDKVSGRRSKKGFKDTNKNTPSPSTNQTVKEENTLSVEEKPQRVKKRHAGYSQEDMELAIRMVKEKEMTVRAAAKKFDVPRSTLHDKVLGRTAVKCNTRRASFLTAAEEALLSNWALQTSDKDTSSPPLINRNDKEENPIAVDEKRVKKRRVGYSQEDMELAVRMVKKKEMTLRAAAKKFNVPKSSLHDKVFGRTAVKCNTRRASFLTAAEEALLSNQALQTSDKDMSSPPPINRNDKEENPIAVDEKPQRVKKRRAGYSQEDMELAVRMVKKKEMTLRAAAQKFNVPKSTLHDKVLGRTAVKCNTGMASFLTAAEEALLSNWALQTSDKDTLSPLPINRNDKEENPIAVDEKPQRVKKRRAGYSQEDMELAVRMVKKKEMTVRAAAKKFVVPRSTLYDKVLGRTAVKCNTGMASFLTAAEEALISNWALQTSEKDTSSPPPINRNDKEENPIAVDEKRVKKRRVGYSQEDMELAVRMVKKKEMTLRAAAKKFNVPRSTLHDKVLGRTAVNCKFGMASFLTAAEETLLSNWVQQMSRIGQCPAKKDIIQVVKKILDEDGRETPFKNNQPGERWFNLFLKRHPELAPGTPILKSKVPNPNFVSPALHKHLTVPLASDSPRLKRENTDETDDLSNSVRLKTSREKKSKQTEEEESVTIKTNIITIVVNGNKKPEVHVRYGEDLDL